MRAAITGTAARGAWYHRRANADTSRPATQQPDVARGTGQITAGISLTVQRTRSITPITNSTLLRRDNHSGTCTDYPVRAESAAEFFRKSADQWTRCEIFEGVANRRSPEKKRRDTVNRRFYRQR